MLAGDRVSQRHAAAPGVQCRHRGQPHRRHRPPLAFHEVSWLPAVAAAALIDPPLPSDIWLRQGFQNIYTGLLLFCLFCSREMLHISCSFYTALGDLISLGVIKNSPLMQTSDGVCL